MTASCRLAEELNGGGEPLGETPQRRDVFRYGALMIVTHAGQVEAISSSDRYAPNSETEIRCAGNLCAVFG